jgi:hypothetical protein
MKRFDTKSLRLIVGATLLCFLILLLPRFISVSTQPSKPSRQPLWIQSVPESAESKRVGISFLRNNFLIFTGRHFEERTLIQGNQMGWFNPISEGSAFDGSNPAPVASPDGKLVVFVSGPQILEGRPSQTRSLHINSSQGGRDGKVVALPYLGESKDAPVRLVAVSNTQVVVSEARSVPALGAQGGGRDTVYDLKLGKVQPIPLALRQAKLVGSLNSSNGVLWLAKLSDWNRGALPAQVRFYDLAGNHHDMTLDPKDHPRSSNEGWHCPSLLLNAAQSRMWGAIQYIESPQPGSTGSVVSWNWPSGKMAWRWQEKATQPVVLSLSPDEKRLAVGSSVVSSGTSVAVDLAILDAQSGKLLEKIKRPPGKSLMGKALSFVQSSKDWINPNTPGVPAVNGLSWTPDSASLIVSYGDGQLIRWLMD